MSHSTPVNIQLSPANNAHTTQENLDLLVSPNVRCHLIF